MSDEVKSIHEFDFSLICEYFSALDRQGPGSSEVTMKALSFIDDLASDSIIADIGCGTGGQTMVIGSNVSCQITGIDLFQNFIEIFNSNANKNNLHHRVKGIVGTMEALPFQYEELDLIWSEGAIYNIGFEKGLNEWHKFLKKGGYIAVTEASWFTDERPQEIEQFWNNAYKEIDTIPKKIEIMQKAGYTLTAAFVLPENCWIENFYIPQIDAQRIFLDKYSGNKTAEDLVANERHEFELYKRYKEYYGYVFYIGRKV